MKKNMGGFDRIFRFLLAAAVILLYLFKVISGTLAIILGIIAIIFIITSFTGFCPLYTPFKISTKKKSAS